MAHILVRAGFNTMTFPLPVFAVLYSLQTPPSELMARFFAGQSSPLHTAALPRLDDNVVIRFGVEKSKPIPPKTKNLWSLTHKVVVGIGATAVLASVGMGIAMPYLIMPWGLFMSAAGLGLCMLGYVAHRQAKPVPSAVGSPQNQVQPLKKQNPSVENDSNPSKVDDASTSETPQPNADLPLEPQKADAALDAESSKTAPIADSSGVPSALPEDWKNTPWPRKLLIIVLLSSLPFLGYWSLWGPKKDGGQLDATEQKSKLKPVETLHSTTIRWDEMGCFLMDEDTQTQQIPTHKVTAAGQFAQQRLKESIEDILLSKKGKAIINEIYEKGYEGGLFTHGCHFTELLGQLEKLFSEKFPQPLLITYKETTHDTKPSLLPAHNGDYLLEYNLGVLDKQVTAYIQQNHLNLSKHEDMKQMQRYFTQKGVGMLVHVLAHQIQNNWISASTILNLSPQLKLRVQDYQHNQVNYNTFEKLKKAGNPTVEAVWESYKNQPLEQDAYAIGDYAETLVQEQILKKK